MAMSIFGRHTYQNRDRFRMHSVPASEESVLRKKILELHTHDGARFDTESLLTTIEGIIHHVRPEVHMNNLDTSNSEKIHKIFQPAGQGSVLDTLPSLLHKISCVLNCKCYGGDSHALSFEILELVTNYSWEAKIVIILASFVVEYAQYDLIAKLYQTNPLAKIIAMLKQIPDDSGDVSIEMRSKIEMIINLVKVSIEVTRLISRFGSLPSKYISNDAEPLVVALDLVPVAVYWMTRVIITCASEFTGIFGGGEITSSYTETWDITSLEQKITTIQTSFSTQLHQCTVYIEEQKQHTYIQKLSTIFSQRIVHVDNQKILQTLLVYKKHGSTPLSYGPDEAEVGVEALKGKTVLLLISSLEISHEEISKLSYYYTESRKRQEHYQYDVVWLPIVETSESVEVTEERFMEIKRRMPWHTLKRPSWLKPGLARYVKEEWKYSKKPIMAVLDQRGRLVNQNAFHMVWTWGNQVYPFTQRNEFDLWNRVEWSLGLLVEEIDRTVSSWIKQDKVICLYGGERHEWIQEFISTTKKIQAETKLNLEMIYIGKNMSSERYTKITQIISNRTVCWDATASTHFWKRIEFMMYSKVQHGAKVPTAKDSGDSVLRELLNMLTLGDCDQGWALISQGAGLGSGRITSAKGDVILKVLLEFESWKVEIRRKGFVVALHEYLLSRPAAEHHCNRLILPGMDDIPERVVCAECGRTMEKYIMYRCCTE